MAASTRAHGDGRQIAAAVAYLDDIYSAPITRADRSHAKHTPCDTKFAHDLVSCGTTHLMRHARRNIAGGKVAAGCAQYLGVPFAGMLAALALAPAGMGYWVGQAVARKRCKRGLTRSDVGIREDKLATAVQALDRAITRFAPVTGPASKLTASDEEYMAIAGDVRQVLWDLEYSLREGEPATRLHSRQLTHAPLIKRPLRHAVRMADALDDQRRKRRADQLS